MTSLYAEERQGHHRIARFSFHSATVLSRSSGGLRRTRASARELILSRLISDSGSKKARNTRGKHRNSWGTTARARYDGVSGTTSYGSSRASFIHRFVDGQKHRVSPYTIVSADSPPSLRLRLRLVGRRGAVSLQDSKTRLSRGFPRFLCGDQWHEVASRLRSLGAVRTRGRAYTRPVSVQRTRARHCDIRDYLGLICIEDTGTRATANESWAAGAHCPPTRVSIYLAGCASTARDKKRKKKRSPLINL